MMADQDDLYYLQPGFDINSLTIPRLRSILVAHDIDYPSSAKKSDLLDIFQQRLLPHSRKLLRDQAKVRRTSKGITDVPSSQESTVDGDNDDDRGLMPPPPAPKTPRGRKSKSNLAGEEMVATPKSSRRSKTPSNRKSSAKQPKASDTETDGDQTRPSARKIRKSASGATPFKTPSVRTVDAKDQRRSLEAEESPFTQDNPFQSGSSPPSESRRLSSSSRTRKSTGSTVRKSTSRRRETKSPPVKQEDSPSSHRTYEFPVAHLSTDKDGIETTEEFTEDAKGDLQRELASNSRLAKSRKTALTRHTKKPASTAAKVTPLALIATILTAVAGWYRQEKIAIGYCGVGRTSWSLADNANIPPWVHENLQPQCEPCPQHAICYPDMEVQCDDSFVLRQHPLSLNGLVPLPPSCEPDSEKQRRIKAVADRAVEELRERRAAFECGEEIQVPSDTAQEAAESNTVVATSQPTLEVSEELLKKTVSKMRRKGMTADEFEDLWRGAIDDIKGREEVTVIEDGSGRIRLSSSSLARLPLRCAIRRSIIRTISQNRIPLSIVIVAFVALFEAWRRITDYNKAKTQTPSLVAMTLDRLATQAALKEDGRVSESFISVGQLRDDVLRHVFSAAERERVWQRVRKVVEANSNIRAATREGGKTGEWSRVWEWIGPVDLAPGLEGRRSGGIQRSVEDESTLLSQGTPDKREGLELRKWDEGRAIY